MEERVERILSETKTMIYETLKKMDHINERLVNVLIVTIISYTFLLLFISWNYFNISSEYESYIEMNDTDTTIRTNTDTGGF